MDTFGQRLRIQRTIKGWTQGELGEKLTLSQSTIAYYENDTKQPSQRTLKQMSDLFNVSIDYLLVQDEGPIKTLSKAAQDVIDSLDLTDEEIRKKFPFEIDGKPITDEDYKWFIATVRSKRSME